MPTYVSGPKCGYSSFYGKNDADVKLGLCYEGGGPFGTDWTLEVQLTDVASVSTQGWKWVVRSNGQESNIYDLDGAVLAPAEVEVRSGKINVEWPRAAMANVEQFWWKAWAVAANQDDRVFLGEHFGPFGH